MTAVANNIYEDGNMIYVSSSLLAEFVWEGKPFKSPFTLREYEGFPTNSASARYWLVVDGGMKIPMTRWRRWDLL